MKLPYVQDPHRFITHPQKLVSFCSLTFSNLTSCSYLLFTSFILISELTYLFIGLYSLVQITLESLCQ